MVDGRRSRQSFRSSSRRAGYSTAVLRAEAVAQRLPLRAAFFIRFALSSARLGSGPLPEEADLRLVGWGLLEIVLKLYGFLLAQALLVHQLFDVDSLIGVQVVVMEMKISKTRGRKVSRTERSRAEAEGFEPRGSHHLHTH